MTKRFVPQPRKFSYWLVLLLLFAPLATIGQEKADKKNASASSEIRVGIRDFKKLQGSPRLDALEETLPHLMRAALFSQNWLKLSLLGKASQSSTSTGVGGGAQSLSAGSEDVDYIVEGEIIAVDENRIRVDISVRDVLRRSIVLSDFVYFDDSQLVTAMTQFTDRLASALREKVMLAMAGQRLAVVIGPFENSIPDPKMKFLDASLPLAINEGTKAASASSLIFRQVTPGRATTDAGEKWDIRVSGKISQNADAIVVSATYQERTGLTLPIQYSGPVSQPLEVVDSFSKKVWEVLKARVRAEGGFRDEPALFANPTAEKLFNLAAENEKKAQFDLAIFLYHTAINKKPDYAEARLRLGDLYVQQESYALAEAEFKELLALDSRSARAHLGLGVVFSKRGRYPEATSELEKALSLASTDAKLQAETYMRLGDVCLLRNQPDQSIEYYSKAATAGPASSAPFLALGKAYRAKNDLNAAIDTSKKGLALWPEDKELKNDLAATYNAAGQQRADAKEYPAAFEFYKKTIALDPPDNRLKAAAYLQAGAIQGWNLGDFKLALPYLEKAVELRPEEELNHRTLGVALQFLDRYKDSVTELQKAIAVSPTYDGYADLSYSYMNLDDYDHGIEFAKKALELDAAKWRAYALVGANYESKYLGTKKMEFYGPAEENLKIAVQKNTENEALYRLLGILYQTNGELEKAVGAFQQALKIRPKVETYSLLADIYEKIQKPDDAIASLLLGLKLDRKQDDFYNSLDRLYRQAKQSDRYLEILKETTQLEPKFVPPYIRLGAAERAQEHYDLAIQWLEKALAIEPQNEWALRVMGFTYSSMGDKNKDRAAHEKAVQFLNQANASSPSHWSYTELGRISQINGDEPKAIELLQEAIKLNTQYKDAYDLLGPLLDKAHRANEMLALLEAAVAKNSKNTWARSDLIDRYLRLDRNDDVIQQASVLVQLNPQDAEAYSRMAAAQQAKKEYDKALLNARKAAEIDPKNGYAIWTINSVLVEQKQYTQAIAELQGFLKAVPNSALVYALLANDSRLANDLPKALEYAGKSIELAPSYPYAKWILGQTYFDAKKYPEAIEQAKAALQLNPELYDAINLMREANHAMGKDQDTVVFLDTLQAANPQSIQLLNSIGFICEEYTQDFQKSYDMFSKAYQLAPDDPTIAQNFAEINLIVGKLDAVLKFSANVLDLPNAPFQTRLNMKMLQISAYLLQGEQGKAFAELGLFRDMYSKIPKDYERRLKFEGLKKFFNSRNSLKPAEKTMLLRMIDLLEAPKEDADAKLRQFEASFAQFFRDLKAGGAPASSGNL